MIDSAVLRKLRTGRGLSQGQLAAAVGVAQQLIAQLETEHVRSTRAIFDIARVLGVAAHVLDPDIPAIQGLAAKITDDLNEIDEEHAAHLLQNLDNEIRFAKGRYPKKPRDGE